MTSASQIAVVGDRLFTDVMMANLMGSHGVWIKDGVIAEKSIVSVRQGVFPVNHMMVQRYHVLD